MQMLFLCLAAGLLSLTALADRLSTPKQVGFAAANEVSGMVKSRRFDDVYWLHNDSGDEPRLFAVDSEGAPVFPGFLRGKFSATGTERGKMVWPGHRVGVATNVDWEDIATDGEMLYVADVGNNGNARRDLGVYVIPEPNPRAVEMTRPISFLPVRYPEQTSFPAQQWHFDSEAMFVDAGRLYFITKHRRPGKISQFEAGAVLYRLDSRHTDQFNVLNRIDQHEVLAVATGADLSPDGRFLAVITYQDLWLFERPAEGDKWLSDGKPFRLALNRLQVMQVESVAWVDDDRLLVGNEAGKLFPVARQDIPARD